MKPIRPNHFQLTIFGSARSCKRIVKAGCRIIKWGAQLVAETCLIEAPAHIRVLWLLDGKLRNLYGVPRALSINNIGLTMVIPYLQPHECARFSNGQLAPKRRLVVTQCDSRVTRAFSKSRKKVSVIFGTISVGARKRFHGEGKRGPSRAAGNVGRPLLTPRYL